MFIPGLQCISASMPLPLILAYTAFVYRVLRGRVTAAWVEAQGKAVY